MQEELLRYSNTTARKFSSSIAQHFLKRLLRKNFKLAYGVAKVTPFLTEALGEDNWELGYNNPSKVLTVVGENDNGKVIQAVEKAGYKTEVL